MAPDRGRAAVQSRPIEPSRAWYGTSPAPGSHRRRGPRWSSLLKIVGWLAALVIVLGGISVALLFIADYNMAGNGSSDSGARVAWVLERGDHLHYAVHLTAGRVFDLCPCTRRTADAHYFYAKFHAITPHQKAALATIHPHSLGEFGAYLAAPLVVGVDWLGDGANWLRGQRPPSSVTVVLDQYEVHPEVIHVARGTHVIWRNADELGEAHTVTADPGTWLLQFDSGWLEPDEQYELTFTERGQYSYYCQAHGAPEHGGMSGVVIVD